MKTTYKVSLGFIFINTLLVCAAANAQEPAKATAQQIKEDKVPGLKYGPKKKAVQPPNNDKEKNYRGSDSKAYLFTDYKKPQQGLNRVSKQAADQGATQARLPSDSPQQAQKEEQKIETPKLPTQGEQ